MADPYMLGDVTIKPQGGGYYDLMAANGDKDRVRGKQKAEARAAEMATPKGGDPESVIPPQPNFDEALAEQAKQPRVATVNVSEGAAPPSGKIPYSQVPKDLTGPMADEKREALAKLGVPTTRIILEESESIPPTGLFVAHNGRSYQLQAGEPADVPNFILSVLDDAIMATALTDQRTKKVVGYRSRSKYPYRRV